MDGLTRYLGGDDVFLSYSRADGVVYAQGLAAELARRGFACRIDLYDTDTSADIPARLKHVIRRAYLFLVIGSPAAWQSKYVQLEIEEFAATGRNFVVVGFGAGIVEARWFDAVAGRVVQERPRALLTGRPSRAIIALAVESFRFQKRNQRLRRVAGLTAASIGVMLLVGAIGAVVLRRNVTQTQAELAGAKHQLTRTESTLGRAQQELSGAQGQLERAKTDLASTEERRTRAAAAAAAQEAIARARKDATDAVSVRNQLGYTPVRDAVNAVRAARSLAGLGLTGEADVVLRSVRSTLPVLLDVPPSQPVAWPEPVEGVIASRDGSIMAGQTRAGEQTVVWRSGASQVLHRFRCGEPAGFVHLAFSMDGRNLAQDCAGRLTVFDLESGARRPGFSAGWTNQVVFGAAHLFLVAQGEVESLAAFDLASGAPVRLPLHERGPRRLVLGPDGRFLVTSCRWYGDTPPADCDVRVYELPTLTQTISLREPDESRSVFSDDGAYLAVRTAGVVRIWDLGRQLLRATYPLPNEATFRFGRSPSRLFVSAADEARVLDTFTGEVLAWFPGARQIGESARVPGEAVVSAAGIAETWRIQPLDTSSFLESPGEAFRLRFDDAGQYFSLCTFEGQEPEWRLSVWETASSRRLREESVDECPSAFQPDVPLRPAAAASAPRTGRDLIHDTKARTLRLVERGTMRTYFEVDFQPRFVTWSQDATLVLAANAQEMNIWRVAGRELLLRRSLPGDVKIVAFSPDNRRLLVASGRGRTRLSLYSWRLADMLAETCSALRINLNSRFDSMRPDRALLAQACPE